jgi:hypothetical protein
MRVHRPPAGPGVVLDVGVCVELRKELVESGRTYGQHEGLIAIVA